MLRLLALQGRRPRFQCVTHSASRGLTTRASLSTNASSERVALVQGASRGLGLEYVRQLLQRPSQRVIATCRQPDNAEALQRLKETHSQQLNIVRLDMTEDQSIQEAVEQVQQRHEHLDLLINAAGILHIPGVLSPETALSRLEPQNLQKVFQVNAFGPILVCKAFQPLLAQASNISGASKERPAVIVNMSARVGSITDNRLGGWYSYRASKAALNQLTKTMSIEIARKKQNVACILLHPGTCDTDLSKPFQKNVRPEKLFTQERAIKQLLEIIDRTTMTGNGKFYAWDGQEVPW